MILPRIEIGKLLVEIYFSILNKTIINVLYKGNLICIDGNKQVVYSPIRPEFMLANLFQYRKVDENIWEFDTTILYNQLVGNSASSDPTIIYLSERYKNIEDRVRHYADFMINL